jgi:hypothetical protein
MECKWFHGTQSSRLELIAQHGLLSPNRLARLGFPARYGDSRRNCVYVTSIKNVANGFASLDYGGLGLTRPPILCMGCIQVQCRDRNRDAGAVEVLHGVRPEYLRLHNYQDTGECWPLIWWRDGLR